jgi:hypothetical protein
MVAMPVPRSETVPLIIDHRLEKIHLAELLPPELLTDPLAKSDRIKAK